MSSKPGTSFPGLWRTAGNGEKPLDFSGFRRCSDRPRWAARQSRSGPPRSGRRPGHRGRGPSRGRRSQSRSMPISRSNRCWRQPSLPPNRVHMGQDGEPALLAVIERLVERVGGVGDLLHAPPPWPPCCRRGRAGAPPDRPASAGWNRPAARSSAHWRDRSAAWRTPCTAASTGGHSFSWSAFSLRPAWTAAIRASA